jgi:hypothetical protein
MKKDINAEALNAIYESAKGMHGIGLMSDSELKEFENDCAITVAKEKQRNISRKHSSVPAYTAQA